MYSRSLSALAFVADFPPAAPEFHQRTHRVRLRNLGTTDKKSSHKIKHRKIPKVHRCSKKGGKIWEWSRGRLEKQKGWQR